MKKLLCLIFFFLYLYTPVFAFELPVEGAGAYIACNTDTFGAGTPVRIQEEQTDGFLVTDGKTESLVSKNNILINLPDIIPSIVYKNSNGDRALYRSLGYELDGITGEKLYDSFFYNQRLGYSEYVMPVMYEMAERIMQIQEEMLQDGYTLVIYETYRPLQTQMAVRDSLERLIQNNQEVRHGITNGGWDKSWFIAQNLSNHQRGCAMDVSMAKYTDTKERAGILRITDYTELIMPTDMHELSPRAATFAYGVSSSDKEAWKNVPAAPGMTEGALLLQQYCTKHGLTPLASEWWHFNDLDARSKAVCAGQIQIAQPIGTRHWKKPHKIRQMQQ